MIDRRRDKERERERERETKKNLKRVIRKYTTEQNQSELIDDFKLFTRNVLKK